MQMKNYVEGAKGRNAADPATYHTIRRYPGGVMHAFS